MGGIYEVAAEMSSNVMTCIPSFIKTGSGLQKLIGEEDSQTHRQHKDCTSLLSLFSKEGK
jgi:hypothetical protein